MPTELAVLSQVQPRVGLRRKGRTRLRGPLRDPAVSLTLALGLPALAAALVGGYSGAVIPTIGLTLLAAAAQFVAGVVVRRLKRTNQPAATLVRLGIALALAALLIEIVLPTSFGLYIPVVALAAGLGLREGLIIGAAAVALYLLPVLVAGGPRDPDLLARGVAGAAICALVASGARFFVGNLQRATRDLRDVTARERRRARQIAGIEEVGRLLAAGPTPDSLARVMDVLVERFRYDLVSIYLAQPDGTAVLGAQRGYSTTVDTFDARTGVVGRAMRTHEAQLVIDTRSDPDYVAANADVISEICAPLVVAGAFLGVVNVEATDRRLDRTDLRAMTAVADRLASYLALGRDRDRLEELSIRDPLTGLHNRRHLDASLERLFAARERQPVERREVLSVVLFDLDRFGQLNKDHGLAVGDEALRRFGRILAERFRRADIVARYGGEEFLVLLTGAGLTDADRLANDVRTTFEQASKEGGAPAITVSAGCASMAVEAEETAAELIAVADAALSMAKRAGRNRVVSAG